MGGEEEEKEEVMQHRQRNAAKGLGGSASRKFKRETRRARKNGPLESFGGLGAGVKEPPC